jgi:serine/threonine protein kinase
MFSFLRSGVKKDYDIEKKILGEGKFATVRKAVNRQTGQQVAVKTIFKDRIKKNKVITHEMA